MSAHQGSAQPPRTYAEFEFRKIEPPEYYEVVAGLWERAYPAGLDPAAPGTHSISFIHRADGTIELVRR